MYYVLILLEESRYSSPGNLTSVKLKSSSQFLLCYLILVVLFDYKSEKPQLDMNIMPISKQACFLDHESSQCTSCLWP